MKRHITEREEQLKKINIYLNTIDKIVKDGVLTRKELTDVVLRRHILSMKQVMRYAEKNLNG